MSASSSISTFETPARQYLRRYLLLTALLVGPPLALVMLVDPLWHFGGNRLTGENYAFNEREAKAVWLMKNMDRYDCVMFGSSRVTMVRTDGLVEPRCYNLAFSGGRVEEFLEYAKYLADRGFRPSLVIVGVDWGNFVSDAVPEVPAFISARDRPPGVLDHYLSFGALDLTRRTLQGQSPHPRYYDRERQPAVLRDAPVYSPPSCWAENEKPWFRDRLQLYIELLDKFPGARKVGYVPPVSAWDFAALHFGAQLDAYTETMARLAGHFDAFYDFAAPSEMTADPSRTYDGSHYSIEVNEVIFRGLAAEKAPFGLEVQSDNGARYRAEAMGHVRRFLEGSGYGRCGEPRAAASARANALAGGDGPRGRPTPGDALAATGTDRSRGASGAAEPPAPTTSR